MQHLLLSLRKPTRSSILCRLGTLWLSIFVYLLHQHNQDHFNEHKVAVKQSALIERGNNTLFTEQVNQGKALLMPYPAYYINMNGCRERRRMMNKFWRPLFVRLRRIPALDVRNLTAMKTLINDTKLYAEHVSRVRPGSTPELDKIFSTEFGVILSHLVAIREAYNSGCQAAVILEDDIATTLTPFWTYTPQDALRDAEAATANWTIIQVRCPCPTTF
jgi:hypothetical protein